MTNYSRIDFVGSLRNFTRLQSLLLRVYFVSSNETFELWEFVASFFSTASPHPCLKELSILAQWFVLPRKAEAYLSDGCGFVLENAEALEPILENYMKGLSTLHLTLEFLWPSEVYFKWDNIPTKVSQSVNDGALREKLCSAKGRSSIVPIEDW